MTCAEIRFARDQGMGGSYLSFVHQATHAEKRFSGGNGYCMPFGWSSWARTMAIVRYEKIEGSRGATWRACGTYVTYARELGLSACASHHLAVGEESAGGVYSAAAVDLEIYVW